jgi:chromosome segregation ATPase
MFYLTAQIAFLLTIASLIGLAVGWWVRNKITQLRPTLSTDAAENPFDARFRLEQCHRDNATLRRDLKETEERAEKLQTRIDNGTQQDGDMLERLEMYEIRVQALMDDLQMRDDTIAVLENELEQLRDQIPSSNNT